MWRCGCKLHGVMAHSRSFVLRALLPLTVFVVALEAHFLWHAWNAPASACCPAGTSAEVCCEIMDGLPPTQAYFSNQDFWLGISYALPLAFSAVALRRFMERRYTTDRRLAVGGLTFSGVFAGTACFFTGCCGSPMLAVYANILGVGFLPFAKPLFALLSAVSVLIAWGWMARRTPKRATIRVTCSCKDGCC